MTKEKAKNIFLGKDGEKRQNCAQAVLSAFKNEMRIDENLISLAQVYGGGGAPEGVCGAYWSGKAIIEKYCCPEKSEEFEKYFKEKASSLSCKEIRAKRQLPCLGCVEEAANFIHRASRKIT